jgi:hypothetical protein
VVCALSGTSWVGCSNTLSRNALLYKCSTAHRWDKYWVVNLLEVNGHQHFIKHVAILKSSPYCWHNSISV